MTVQAVLDIGAFLALVKEENRELALYFLRKGAIFYLQIDFANFLPKDGGPEEWSPTSPIQNYNADTAVEGKRWLRYVP